MNDYIVRNQSTEAKPQPYYCNNICKYGPWHADADKCKQCCDELLAIINDPDLDVNEARKWWDRIINGTN